jgi:2-phospho-L-lactate guanylyltransferase
MRLVRATAIVPIKRFGAAKQRLSDALQPAERVELAGAMAADALELIGRATLIERTIVVSGEPSIAAIAAAAGAELLDDPTDEGHSEAAARGVATALTLGAECVALLPADCPLLEPAEIDAALGAMEPGSVAVIPDRHGSGTNGLLLRPPDAITPAFGPGSQERHLRLAADAGMSGYVADLPSLGLDLDTGEDLTELRRRLEETKRAPRTRAALR